MNLTAFRRQSLPLIFILFILAQCHKPADTRHYTVMLKAAHNDKPTIDATLATLNERLTNVYHGAIKASASGSTITLHLTGKQNLDSLLLLTTSKGAFSMWRALTSTDLPQQSPELAQALSGMEYTGTASQQSPQIIFATRYDTAEQRQTLASALSSMPHPPVLTWGTLTDEGVLPLYALDKPTPTPPITKNMISTAASDFDQLGRPSIAIKLKEAYFGTFLQLTRETLNHPLAICLDNHVLSAPIVSGEIPAGSLVISGYFTQHQANIIAALISSPELPTNLTLFSSDTALRIHPRGYPSFAQTQRYNTLQAAYLKNRTLLNTIIQNTTDWQKKAQYQNELNRIYRNDLNSLVTKYEIPATEVDKLLLQLETLLNQLTGVTASQTQKSLDSTMNALEVK